MLSGAVVYPPGIALALLVLVLQRDRSKALIAIIAIAHLTILISVALFPIPIDPDQVTGVRAGILHSAERSAPNFIPFASIGQVLAGHGARGTTLLLVLNLFVLFPAGIYLPHLVPGLRRAVAFPALVIIGGTSIEVAQLAISSVLGFRYRFIDIDDAILNGAGLGLGWVVVAVGSGLRARSAVRRD